MSKSHYAEQMKLRLHHLIKYHPPSDRRVKVHNRSRELLTPIILFFSTDHPEPKPALFNKLAALLQGLGDWVFDLDEAPILVLVDHGVKLIDLIVEVRMIGNLAIMSSLGGDSDQFYRYVVEFNFAVTRLNIYIQRLITEADPEVSALLDFGTAKLAESFSGVDVDS